MEATPTPATTTTNAPAPAPAAPASVPKEPAVKPNRAVRRGPPRSSQFSTGHGSAIEEDSPPTRGRHHRDGGRRGGGRGGGRGGRNKGHHSDHPLDAVPQEHHQRSSQHETKAPKFVYGGLMGGGDGSADPELQGALRARAAQAAAAATAATTVPSSTETTSSPSPTPSPQPRRVKEKKPRKPKAKNQKQQQSNPDGSSTLGGDQASGSPLVSSPDASPAVGRPKKEKKKRNLRKRENASSPSLSPSDVGADPLTSSSASTSASTPLTLSSDSTPPTGKAEGKKEAPNLKWKEQRKLRRVEKAKKRNAAPSAEASSPSTPSSEPVSSPATPLSPPTPATPSTPSVEQGAQVVAALARRKKEKKRGKEQRKDRQASPVVSSSPSEASSTPSISPAITKKQIKYRDREQWRRGRKWYSEYLSQEQVAKGLAEGTLVKGVLRVNPHNRQLSYVTVEGIDRDVLVETVKLRNRAFDNDVVVLRLFSEDEELVEDQKRKDRKKQKERERKGRLQSQPNEDDKKTKRQEKRQKRKEKKNKKKAEEGLAAKEQSPATPQEEKKNESAQEQKTEGEDKKSGDETKGEVVDASSSNQAEAGALAASLEKLQLDEKKAETDGETKKKEEEDGETKKRRIGEVVAILEANHSTELIGYIRPAKKGDQTAEVALKREDKLVFFIPVDKKAPRVVVNIKDPKVKNLVRHFDEWTTHLFVCKLDPEWPATTDLPRGSLIENLGRAGELEVELDAILRTHGVDQADFSQEIINALPDPENWRVTEDEVKKRRDLRNLRIFTIDPATARDMDDAISCILEPGSDEIAEVGVHIADVTYFLAQGSPLDELAKKKATTVYVVEYSIPMLPRTLSDTLCSLTPHEDRYSISIIWRMNIKTGKFVDEKPWIGRTIMRSCVKMDYGTAQRMIEGDFDSKTEQLKLDPAHPEHTSELVRRDVVNLDRIAKVLRKERFDNGALGLNSVKLSFIFDRSEQTNTSGGKPRLSVPTSCFSYITKDSNHLIEEFAILANEAIAQKTSEVYPDNALVRYHESPREDIMADFIIFCDKLGIKIDYSSSGALHRSIQAAADPQDPYKLQVLQFLATKASKQAKYICTGTGGVVTSFHHYALCADLYTHFTSPIRRYADVAVHRILMAALENKPKPPINSSDLEQIAKNCNEKKVKSMRAQEDCDFLYLCAMLNKKPLKQVGVVIGLTKNTFEIMLPELGEAHLIYPEDYPEIVDQKFDVEKNTLSLGLSEDYDVGGEEEEASGRDYFHHGTGRGERESNRRKEERGVSTAASRHDDGEVKRRVGKWIHLQVFSRVDVEARGEVAGTGKKLALKLRVLF